jgi:fatty acid desaturase
MFRFKEDRLPVFIILAISFLDFILYLWLDNIWILAAYGLLMVIPRGCICAWNHHHQHVPTFKPMLLNRILEFFYALHTGVTTHLWRLHHVIGHHLNYLDQSKDESRWQTAAGEKMGELRYSMEVAITAYYRGYKAGIKHPKTRREFLLFSFITLAVVILLSYLNTAGAMFIYVLPMIASLIFTSWATYGHHAGLDTENEYEASFNNLSGFYNKLTGNLGYHTAHHVRCNLHWSKLPDFHAKIEDKIPKNLIINRKFNIDLGLSGDVLTPTLPDVLVKKSTEELSA